MPDNPPWFAWCPSDAENDEVWRAMTYEERGVYMTLLNMSWENDGISSDLKIIARTLRIEAEHFEDLWLMIGRKFNTREDGRLVNPRQEKARVTAIEKSQKAVGSANRRWANRRISEIDANALPSHCDRNARASEYKSYSSVLSEEGAGETKKSVPVAIDEKSKAVDFDIWAESVYRRHPKRSGKYLALLKLKDRLESDFEARLLFDKNHKLWCKEPDWLKSNGKYCPQLAKEDGGGWIDDDGWMHPPIREDPAPVNIPLPPHKPADQEFLR